MCINNLLQLRFTFYFFWTRFYFVILKFNFLVIAQSSLYYSFYFLGLCFPFYFVCPNLSSAMTSKKYLLHHSMSQALLHIILLLSTAIYVVDIFKNSDKLCAFSNKVPLNDVEESYLWTISVIFKYFKNYKKKQIYIYVK